MLMTKGIKDIAETSLGDLIGEMSELNAEKITMTAMDDDEQPIAAVIVLQGDNIQETLDALESVDQ